MNRGVFALFGLHTASTINTVKSFSSTFRMPYITTSLSVNTSRQEHGYELYMRPLYAQAIVDVLRKHGWTDLWYIYNSNEGRWWYILINKNERVIFFCTWEPESSFETDYVIFKMEHLFHHKGSKWWNIILFIQGRTKLKCNYEAFVR